MKIGLKHVSMLVLALGASTLVNLGTAQAANAACVDYIYRQGSSSCIRHIQVLSNFYGYKKLTVDGVYGPLTTAAIKQLQAGFSQKVDGIVGPKTWSLLCTYQAGWTDENGINHMALPDNWPLANAKAAGCSKYWKGTYVGSVLY